MKFDTLVTPETLEPNAFHDRVLTLRHRLHALGEVEQKRTLRKLASADPNDFESLLDTRLQPLDERLGVIEQQTPGPQTHRGEDAEPVKKSKGFRGIPIRI